MTLLKRQLDMPFEKGYYANCSQLDTSIIYVRCQKLYWHEIVPSEMGHSVYLWKLCMLIILVLCVMKLYRNELSGMHLMTWNFPSYHEMWEMLLFFERKLVLLENTDKEVRPTSASNNMRVRNATLAFT